MKEIDECPENLCDTMTEFKKAFNEKRAAIDTQVKTAESIKNSCAEVNPVVQRVQNRLRGVGV